METSRSESQKRVFRVTGIPHHVKQLSEVAELLSRGFAGTNSSDVLIYSLATTLNPWERPPSKEATVQFVNIPDLLCQGKSNEWFVDVDDCPDSLRIDSHFFGLTPLNDVPASKHDIDCITISGLASHPFGSWQPRGSDKKFMWIRDELPACVPGVRAIVYGYDTTLLSSTSSQSISDVARGFIQQLRTFGWNSTTAKPLMFLAHSLGGVVLKDSLVQIADARNVLDRCILDKIEGAIMFGVPSLGMEQAHLLTMVEGQANEILVQDLSRDSNYLKQLDSAFSGISFTRDMRIFWGYETLESQTVMKHPDGSWDRRGPLAMLVNKESATCRFIHKNPSSTFPINKDHSDMVKFTKRSHISQSVFSMIRVICMGTAVQPSAPATKSSELVSLAPVSIPDSFDSERNAQDMILRFGFKDLTDFLTTFDAPNLDARLEGVEERFHHTFEWAFRLNTFTDWLSDGKDIFWIRGKPGSGKSTLMKFIYKDQRTSQLLHRWRPDSREIRAAFFFHYRGTAIQKSFEGVLRSLVKQVLKQRPDLCTLLIHMLDGKVAAGALRFWTFRELEQALYLLLNQQRYKLDVHLFFDALDEFDGHPRLISRFLQDLMTISSNSSYSKLKICFSSRPWETFMEYFGDCPSFSLQEHTESDIRSYCLGNMVMFPGVTSSILKLLPEIIFRAAGVFLWVKLVMLELSRFDETPTLDELEKTLRSLPTELDQFFVLIVRRIPDAYRWETYALLELVIRSDSASSRKVTLDYVIDGIHVSNCFTIQQALRMTQRFASPESLQERIQQIATWSGGLVEVVSNQQGCYPQTMHQTVHEFVTSLEFKHIVLEEIAKITDENGHSFRLKTELVYLHHEHSTKLMRPGRYMYNPARNIFLHALMAEITTGKSQRQFIDSALPALYQKMEMNLDPKIRYYPRNLAISTSLGFAAFAGLKLYFRDVMNSDPHILQSSSEMLLSLSLAGLLYPRCHDILAMFQLALQGGFRLSQDPDVFLFLFRHWITLEHGADSTQMPALTDLEDLIILLLNHGQDPDTYLEFEDKPFLEEWPKFSALHIASPRVAKELLQRGADPNRQDSLGNTPIDYAMSGLKRIFQNVHIALSTKDVFDMCYMIAEAGGRPMKTNLKDWRHTLHRFERHGCNVQPLVNILQSRPLPLPRSVPTHTSLGPVRPDSTQAESGREDAIRLPLAPACSLAVTQELAIVPKFVTAGRGQTTLEEDSGSEGTSTTSKLPAVFKRSRNPLRWLKKRHQDE